MSTVNITLPPKARKLQKQFKSRLLRLGNIIASTYEGSVEVDIYAFADESGGIRISEIGVSIRTPKGGIAGESWMQSEAAAAPLIFAAERYLLNADIPPERPEGWCDNLDYAQEAEQRLIYSLTGKWPEWVEKEIPA